MLPDLRRPESLVSLRNEGYQIGQFAGPKNYAEQASILDIAISTLSSLTTDQNVVSDTAFLVLDSLLRRPAAFEFFLRFPKEEAAQFCHLAARDRVIPMASPVCPDYQGHYQLSDGVDDTADRVLTNLITLSNFFGNRNFGFFINMHVADVEAFEPLILAASGETTESFLAKTGRSIIATQKKIYSLGLQGVVSCSSMLEAFSLSRLDYLVLKESNARKITNHSGRIVRKTIEALAAERVKLGDFDFIDADRHKPMAADELSNYSTYGDLIDGRAVILSPDTLSPMAAYNFLRDGHDGRSVNPTIFVKEVKIKNFSVFMD